MRTAAKDNNKWKRIVKAGLVVLALALVVDVISQVVTYPTEHHHQVGVEVSELTWSSADGSRMSAADESQLAKLDATPENQYSTRASLITGIVQTIFYIGVTYYLYSYIRRNGLARKVVGTVTLVMTSIALISSVVLWLIYSGGLFYSGGIPLTIFLAGLPVTALVVGLVSYLVASLCESWYKRRNSFEM